MNTSDLQTALLDRLEAAVERAKTKAEACSCHSPAAAFAEGMQAALDVVDGVFYEWGEMVSNQQQSAEEHY